MNRLLKFFNLRLITIDEWHEQYHYGINFGVSNTTNLLRPEILKYKEALEYINNNCVTLTQAKRVTTDVLRGENDA